MSPRFTLVSLFVVLSVAWHGTSLAAPPCPATFNALETTETTCQCAPDKLNGPLYGTRIYTTDSSVCAAALHVGVIRQSGGVVTVKAAPGCLAYLGSTNNGLTSNAWSAYEGSFFFPQIGAPICPDPNATGTGDPDFQMAIQFRPGERVACRWRANDVEYAGTVQEIRGGRLMILYDDQDKELIGPALCRKGTVKKQVDDRPVTGPPDPKLASQYRTGDRVQCRWQDGKVEYAGMVKAIEAGRLSIDYDDGGKETIAPSLCRREALLGR
jgi:hypothetical protein